MACLAPRLGQPNSLNSRDEIILEKSNHKNGHAPFVYWRVEGTLLELTTVRPIAFFTTNAQSFLGRTLRRAVVLAMAILRPLLYFVNRAVATRVVHAVLRGVSRDRLDLLGEEFFKYKWEPNLDKELVGRLRGLVESGANVVLVSHSLDHQVRPLAQYLGVKWIVANRLEFRNGFATGRLLDPVIRPKRTLERLFGRTPKVSRDPDLLVQDLGLPNVAALESAIVPAVRDVPVIQRPVVYFDTNHKGKPLSVRRALAGKHLMLVGVTGFIGKVWLANLLKDLPEVGRIYLLIRRQKSNPAVRRFEKIVEDSPVFDPLFEKYGPDLPRFLHDRIEIIEGDLTSPGLGLDSETAAHLKRKLDLVINSSGLTDFNPDLRDALTTNVDAAVNMIEFIRQCDHAGLLHLSTCYVAGARDGRVSEKLRPNYTPVGKADFDAEEEWHSLQNLIRKAEADAEGPEVTAELTMQAMAKEHAAKDLQGAALENQIRKNRIRWLKTYLTEAGMKRARELGWPNTYTLTKSLAESLIYKHGAGLPIAVVRPAIVETSVRKPFRGWNEGINTSASLSYLLGTYFRQLPSNERKRLDIIPVDSVCQGMTLIAAAIVERRHEPLYQLATSVNNPCDMGRCIELTSLAHRKHYRAQEGMEHWLRLRFDAISVSKERYRRMSAPAQRAIVRSIQLIMSPLPLRKTPLARTERSLERVEKLVALFEPFILNNEHDFVADNVEKLSYSLVPEEKDDFGYGTAAIDWWEYWINIHIPALRRWTYPLIEGRPLEARPARSFQMAANGVTANTGTNGATWRYS
jgi:long-chain acyl-CoA synthetase